MFVITQFAMLSFHINPFSVLIFQKVSLIVTHFLQNDFLIIIQRHDSGGEAECLNR